MLFLAAIYNAIKEASGQPEKTFIRMGILLIFKIFFNTIYLKFLNLGEIGAAYGSISSYILITIWMYYDLYIKKGEQKLKFLGPIFDKKIILPIVKIAIPAMLNFVLLGLGFLLINLEMLKYSTNVINAQTIASNVNAFCFNLPSSISATVTTMISMNIAIGHKRQAKRVYFFASIYSMIIAFMIIIFMKFFDVNVIHLFRTDEDVVSISKLALFYYNWSILPFGIFSVAQGVFIAFGRTRIPLLLSFLRIWLLRYLFIVFTERYLSYHAVFIGNLFSNIVGMFIIIIILAFIPWESVLNKDFLDENDVV